MKGNKKWTAMDIISLIVGILAPIISVVVAFIFPSGKTLTEDVKLVIIGAGIVIPIITLQLSLTVGQNKNEDDVHKLETRISELSDKTNHISPIIEKVFMSDNERIKRFVYRRMGEVNKTIQMALSNNNSGNLKPNEYYEELLYLADLIIKDREEQKKKFTGEVWAMTSFAENEWIADQGYEKLWVQQLKKMVDLGITTRRLCVVPDNVYRIITQNPFIEPGKDKENSFWGFIELIESYYSKNAKQNAKHFFIRPNDNIELTKIKGFFAIKLSDGELHILHGETVDENGAMTAKVLFDRTEIQRVRDLFELFASEDYEIGKVIHIISKNNGFEEYLRKHNITFGIIPDVKNG